MVKENERERHLDELQNVEAAELGRGAHHDAMAWASIIVPLQLALEINIKVEPSLNLRKRKKK